MMDAGKLGRILKSMEEHDVPQLIISDPTGDLLPCWKENRSR